MAKETKVRVQPDWRPKLKTFISLPRSSTSSESTTESTTDSWEDSGDGGFNTILKQVGDYNKWQWRLFAITSVCGIFAGFHNLAAVFLAASPDHWCMDPNLQDLNITQDLRNISIPWVDDGDGHGHYETCIYYERNWTELLASGALDNQTLPDLPTNVSTRECNQWFYNHSIYKSTVVNEWSLMCSNKYLMSLVQSTYMAGVAIGALILSELSDRYGRRTISLLSVVGLLVTSISTSFSTNFVIFLILRFFVAAFVSGVFLPNFVILMEMVGPEGRTVMGMAYQALFGIGFMILPVIAYFERRWRYLQLCISVPSVVLLLYYWFLPESPCWLLVRGKYLKGLEIIRKIAKVNGKSFHLGDNVFDIMDKIHSEGIENHGKKREEWRFINYCKSIRTLLSTTNMRNRSLVIFFAWFVISMVYYGLTFSGSNLNASIYVLVFLSGAVEIPSYLLVSWTLNVFGRRANLSALLFICGISCLLITSVPKDMMWLNVTLATIGKFFNSAAFGVAYIYSAELVPTRVRNVALGTSSVLARIGSAMAPFIVDLVGDVHYTAPSVIFGMLSLAAGAISLMLPETGGTRLPETIAEVEDLPR